MTVVTITPASAITTPGWWALSRAYHAVERVTERLICATTALDAETVPYAVVGGCAVKAWMQAHGEGGERNTPDVDILVRRADLLRVVVALTNAGFVYRFESGCHAFLDNDVASLRSGIHLVFVGETVRATNSLPHPDIVPNEKVAGFTVLPFAALVQTKLVAYRTVDRVHLLDMIGVGLIDETWVSRFPAELGARLQALLDDPDG